MPDKQPSLSNDELRGLYSLTVHPEWKTLLRWLEIQRERLASQFDGDRNPAARDELVGKRLMAARIAKLGKECMDEAKSRNFRLDEPG